jgi:hypothetical protein
MNDIKAEIRLAKVVHVGDLGFAPGPLEVVINRGMRDGVKAGDRFLVFGTGPHIADPDTGEDLGALEGVRGRGQVVHVQEHLSTIRSIERRRTRPAKRITRQPGWGTGGGIMAGLIGGTGSVVEEELSQEEEVPFESVQLGDLAKPI